MQKHNILQQSPEWFALRLQYPLTASKAQAIATGGAGLETLCWEIVAQRHSTAEREVYTNKDLERGNELEPQARSIYELENDCIVEEVGFITNETISKVGGASPDGLVGTDGNLEIKSPKDITFIKLLAEYNSTGIFKVDSGYMWQMQMQMLFAERDWTDYIVYNPNFTQSLLLQRITKDEVAFEKLKVGLKKGESIINDIELKLK